MLAALANADARRVYAEVVLERTAQPKREGVHRFVLDGRIEQYPVRPADRRHLLSWVVEQSIRLDESLSEAEVNDRLAPFHRDVATLRRCLIDDGLLWRTPSGSSYSRPSSS